MVSGATVMALRDMSFTAEEGEAVDFQRDDWWCVLKRHVAVE